MAFPTTPTNGQIATVNGITFSYASATNSWTRVSSALYNIANIVVTSNANVGNLNATNNVTGSIGNFSGNVHAGGVVGTTYYGQINLGTTSVNLNRASDSQTFTGIGIDGTATTATNSINSQLTANTSAGTAYVTFAKQTTGNVPLNATTSLTFNPSTGNLTTYGMFTSTGVYWASNGAAYSSGGGSYTANATAPSGPTVGSVWYDTTSDIIFQYINDGTNDVWVDISSAFTYSNATVTGSTLSITGPGAISGNLSLNNWIIPVGANTVQNIGTTTQWWGTFYGTSSQARYADLAENYLADAEYAPGTVVVFGGLAEISVTDKSHDTRVAGVISTDPAYLMNAGNIEGLPVALTGRVPCLVHGPVNKGTVLVTSSQPGVAEALNNDLFEPGCVIGKSLEMIADNSVKTIEIVVGRF